MARKGVSIMLLVVLTVVFVTMEYFSSSSWRIAYEQQAYLRCLPYEFSLVNRKKPNHIEKGDLVVVSTEKYPEYYRKGVELLKLIVGVPGDKVNISPTEVKINDEIVAIISETDPPFSPSFIGQQTLGPNEYWAGGVSNVSIDSRYIGPITPESIVGEAYALF